MDRALTSRAVVVGHVTLTVPAIAAILLVPFLGLRMFGPFLLVYYVLAGMTVGWQWYSVALPEGGDVCLDSAHGRTRVQASDIHRALRVDSCSPFFDPILILLRHPTIYAHVYPWLWWC